MAAKNAHVDSRQCVRRVGKTEVKPVLYNGRAIGQGKYFTGSVDGQIITDLNGKPLPLREIGKLISHEEFDILYPSK
jgi:small ligand-binding sensory domain FIST